SLHTVPTPDVDPEPRLFEQEQTEETETLCCLCYLLLKGFVFAPFTHQATKTEGYFTEGNEGNEGVFGLGFSLACGNPLFASLAPVRILLSLWPL
ncbi:MAG: hypothetical protein WBZ19_12845, partial [Chthoniobacterales bacterium]